MKTIASEDIILGRDLSSSRRWGAFFAIAFIYFFYCYNFMIGTFIKPTMLLSVQNGGFGFTLTQTEQIFSCMSFGMIIGTVFFGKLSAAHGKKRTYICVSLMISAMTLLPLFHPTSFSLWFFARTMTGIALGGVYGVCMPLVIDLFPSRYSGKLTAMITSLFSLAIIFGGKLYGFLGDANWRLLILTAVIPPLIGAALVFLLVPDDIHIIRGYLLEGKQNKEKITYRNMYKGKYLWIGIGTILLSGINFVAQESYTNNVTAYLTTELGISVAVAGAIYSVQGIGQFVGYLFWGSVADKYGQKIPLFVMAACSTLTFTFARLSPTSITSFYIVSILFGFGVGYTGSWGAYYAALFPARFKSLSVGTSFNGGRIISAVGLPLVTLLAGGPLGMRPIFYVSSVMFIAGSVVWALLPETKNKNNMD